MITQNSNNKPSGYTGKTCDSGTPISGITSTQEYQIIKVNSDGSIVSGLSPLAGTNNYILNNAQNIPLVAGAPPTGTFLGFIPVGGQIQAGSYSINPTFIYDGNAGGGISFILYRSLSLLDTYINTLPPFNPFLPTITDLSSGLAGYWHNTSSQQLGAGTIFTSYNRNNSLTCYLDAGLYFLAIITDGATSFNVGNGLAGFYEFNKLG